MLDDMQKRLLDRNIRIKVDNAVKDYLVEHGFDQKQGARPLRRSIQEHFEDQLADRLLKANLRADVSVKAVMKKDHVSFSIRRLVAPVEEIPAAVSSKLVTSA